MISLYSEVGAHVHVSPTLYPSLAFLEIVYRQSILKFNTAFMAARSRDITILAILLAAACFGTAVGWFVYLYVATGNVSAVHSSSARRYIQAPSRAPARVPDYVEDWQAAGQYDEGVDFVHQLDEFFKSDEYVSSHPLFKPSIHIEDVPTDNPAWYKHVGSAQLLRGHVLDPDLLQHLSGHENVSRGPHKFPGL